MQNLGVWILGASALSKLIKHAWRGHTASCRAIGFRDTLDTCKVAPMQSTVSTNALIFQTIFSSAAESTCRCCMYGAIAPLDEKLRFVSGESRQGYSLTASFSQWICSG